MIKKAISQMVVLIIASLFIISCGGGGGSGYSGDPDTDVVSIGAVEKLGSVYVNGVRYDTSTSNITVDDNPGSESDLRAGQTVVVNGTINNDGVNGVAQTVAVRSVVKGSVSANNFATSRSLTVLGQTVQITDLTIVDNSISDILALLNTDVEIHGHVRGQGVIEATYIEAKALLEYKIIGVATNITASSFMIGSQSINYTNEITSGLSDGALVEVKGATTLDGGNLVASKVEAIGLSQTNLPKIEIEGFVTSLNSPSSFTLGNQPVTTDNSTRFEGGLADEITVASKLEVEGRLVDGVLQASKVSFRYNIKIEGDIASYTEGVMSITGLPGISIVVDALTEIDGTTTDGRHVRLRGYKSRAGDVNAIRVVDRGNADPRLILQGPVEAISAGSNLTTMGIVIDTGSVTQFRDVDDTSVSAATFYSLIDLNSIVKVRDDNSTGGVAWDNAEIEYR